MILLYTISAQAEHTGPHKLTSYIGKIHEFLVTNTQYNKLTLIQRLRRTNKLIMQFSSSPMVVYKPEGNSMSWLASSK